MIALDLFVIVNGEARPVTPEELEKIAKKKLKLIDCTGKILMRKIEKDVLMLKLFGKRR